MWSFFNTIFEIAYFGLYVLFFYLFFKNKSDARICGICAAAIVGHTVLLAWQCMLLVEEAWPFCIFYEKYGPKGFEGLDVFIIILIIEILLLIAGIIWCFILKSKGMFVPKYFLFSLAMFVIDFVATRGFGEIIYSLGK